MNLYETEVVSVVNYTDTLFSFRTTRPKSLRFSSGEFTMIGLPEVKRTPDAKMPLLRAYSIASPHHANYLEFYSIKVPDGPLTQHLAKIQPGDKVKVGAKPTGTLVYDALLSGKNLWLLCTGTGFAPFASIIQDPEVYEKFETVTLVHGSRYIQEHTYVNQTVAAAEALRFTFWNQKHQLRYIKSTTREEDYTTIYSRRITDHIRDGSLFWEGGTLFDPTSFDPKKDRVMICGSESMTKELAQICTEQGLKEGSISQPGDFVIEKAFVG